MTSHVNVGSGALPVVGPLLDPVPDAPIPGQPSAGGILLALLAVPKISVEGALLVHDLAPLPLRCE